MKVFLALIVFLFLSVAQANSNTLSTYLLSSPDAFRLKNVANYFEIESRKGNEYEVIVPADQANLFTLLAPDARLLSADNSAALRARLASFASSQPQLLNDFNYHQFAEVRQWMQDLEAKFPKLVKVIQYGNSQQNNPLLALRITKDTSLPEGPSLMITAATHGDELITVEVLMNLVDQMLAGYGTNDRFTQMLDKHNLFIIPVLNPDGFVNRDRYDNGRDPNRSYPFPERPNNIPTTSISGIMQFFASKNIIGSIDFHAYGEMVMYPWAYTHNPIDPVAGQHFNDLTKSMAESNGYAYGPISDVIYVAPGSSADYYFWQKNSVSLGIEMGHDKVPNPSEFPQYFQSQSESTWRFIESFR